MKSTKVLIVVALLLVVLALVGCIADPNPNEGKTPEGADKPAGFWAGLWHGIILPGTFIWSLFSDKVTIYEVSNNGNWYNFGFLLGVFTLGGSSSAAAK